MTKDYCKDSDRNKTCPKSCPSIPLESKVCGWFNSSI